MVKPLPCLYITPDTRRSNLLQGQLLRESATSVAMGSSVLSYAAFLEAMLRHLDALRESYLMSPWEKNLLLHYIVEEQRSNWPVFLHDNGLVNTLEQAIAECKRYLLTPQNLAPLLLGESNGGGNPQLWHAFLAVFTAYQEMLQQRKAHDSEDIALAVLQGLREAALPQVLRSLLTTPEATLTRIEFCYFTTPDLVRENIIQVLRQKTGIEVVAATSPLSLNPSLAALQRLILQGEPPQEALPPSPITISSALHPQLECQLVVQRIKEQMLQGVPSHRIGVVSCYDPGYHECLLQEFEAQQVPWDILLPVTLDQEPLSQGLMQILAAALDSTPTLMADFKHSPLLTPQRRPRFTPPPGDAEENSEEHHLFWPSRLEALRRAATIPQIITVLSQLTAELDWPRRAIPGALPPQEKLMARHRVGQVWQAIQDALQVMLELEPLLPRGGRLLSTFRTTLRRFFQNSPLQLAQGAPGGVQLLSAQQLGGREFTFLVVPGCHAGRFPGRASTDWLLGDSLRQRLGLPSTHIRQQQEKELFAAVLGAAEQLLFTWSVGDNKGNSRERSEYLTQLTMAPHVEIPTTAMHTQLTPATATSPESLRTALYGYGYAPQLHTISESFLGQGAGAIIEQQVQHLLMWQKRDEGFFTKPLLPEIRQPMQEELATFFEGYIHSVTSLQSYSDCPFRFLVERILALSGMEEMQESLQPQDRGSLFHIVMRELLSPSCRYQLPLMAYPREERLTRIDEILNSWWHLPAGLSMHPALWQLEKLKTREMLKVWLALEEEQGLTEPYACEWVFGGKRDTLFCPQVSSCALTERATNGELLCRRSSVSGEALVLQQGELKLLLRGVVDRIDLTSPGESEGVKRATAAEQPERLLAGKVPVMGEELSWGKAATLIDYKSGSGSGYHLKSISSLRYLQLPLYALAWQQNMPGYPVASLAYHFLGGPLATRGNTLKRLSYHLQEPLPSEEGSISWGEFTSTLIQHCFALDQKMRSALFPPLPVEIRICGYCPLLGYCRRMLPYSEEEETADAP